MNGATIKIRKADGTGWESRKLLCRNDSGTGWDWVSSVASGTEVTVDDGTVGTGLLQWEYSAGWLSGGGNHYSSTVGASATLRFQGTKFTLRGARDAHHGIATVTIDGSNPIQVDCYSPTRIDLDTLFDSGVIADAVHTVVYTVSGSKNSSSTDITLAIDDAVVMSTGATTGIALASWYVGGAKPNGDLLALRQTARSLYDKFMGNFLVQTGMPAGMPAGAYRIRIDSVHNTIPNGTFSEGMGYGMLLAAWFGNPNLPDGVRVDNARTVLDGLWTYYKHYRNANGLMHWRIDQYGAVSGYSGATDGDFDVAMALVIAHRMWGSSGPVNYGADATTLINAIRDHEFTAENFTGIGGPNVMLNGDAWDKNGDRYMSDYFRAGFMREFGRHTGDARWDAMLTKNYPIALGYFWNNFSGGVVPHGSTRAGLNNGADPYRCTSNSIRWYGIIADYLWNGEVADPLSRNMSSRMIGRAKAMWTTGGNVKSPPSDLNLTTAEPYYTNWGAGMYGTAALSDSVHSTFAAEVLTQMNNHTTIDYYGTGLAAIAAMFMAGIAQPGS